MATLGDILDRKGRDVLTIGPERTVHELLGTLCQHRVGALLVVEGGGRLLGIVSERDTLNELNARPEDVDRRTVGDIMTRDLVVARPTDSVDYAMAVMTERRFRHLPIVVDGALQGIVSIGDLVKAQLAATAYENLLLHRYIADDYPGRWPHGGPDVGPDER